jgi:hypothetical protein
MGKICRQQKPLLTLNKRRKLFKYQNYGSGSSKKVMQEGGQGTGVIEAIQQKEKAGLEQRRAIRIVEELRQPPTSLGKHLQLHV